MAERHGKNGKLILNGVVLKMTSLSLNQTSDKVEVQGFGDTNKRYVIGFPDLQVSFSGHWDDAEDELFDVIDAGSPVNAYVYPDATNAATQYWWGSAYCDGNIEIPADSSVKVSGTLVAAGNWTRSGVA